MLVSPSDVADLTVVALLVLIELGLVVVVCTVVLVLSASVVVSVVLGSDVGVTLSLGEVAVAEGSVLLWEVEDASVLLVVGSSVGSEDEGSCVSKDTGGSDVWEGSASVIEDSVSASVGNAVDELTGGISEKVSLTVGSCVGSVVVFDGVGSSLVVGSGSAVVDGSASVAVGGTTIVVSDGVAVSASVVMETF